MVTSRVSMDANRNQTQTPECPGEARVHPENQCQALVKTSAKVLLYSYDNTMLGHASVICIQSADLDNRVGQDAMLRSEEWKWIDDIVEDEDDEEEEDEFDDENSGDNVELMQEEDTDEISSDLGFEEAEKSDIPDSSEDTDSHSNGSSHDLMSPDMEVLCLAKEMREENSKLDLLTLHYTSRNFQNSERDSSFQSINYELSPGIISPFIEEKIKNYSIDQTLIGSTHDVENHITVVDKIFSYSSELNLSYDKGRKNRRAVTMQNIHEKDAFLNLTSGIKVGQLTHRAYVFLEDDMKFVSSGALNTIAIQETERDHLIDEDKPSFAVFSMNHTKNVLALSASIALVFIAIGSVRNLQSSINHEGGVGVLSLAVSFIGYMLGSIVSPTIVQIIQPKKCVILGLIPHLVYIASNIYPTLWLLGVTSLFQGASLAIVWNAMSTYITILSIAEAHMKKQAYSQVSSRYFGIFGLFFQSYFIVGNLIASVVLINDEKSPFVPVTKFISSNTSGLITTSTISTSTSEDVNKILLSSLIQALSPRNNSAYLNPQTQTAHGKEALDYLHLCGAQFWQHYDLGDGAYHVSLKTKYLLFGIYMACVVVSILIALFILEPLNPRLFQRSMKRSEQLKKQLHSLLKIWMSPRFLIIVPMLMYSFIEVGFVTAEVTKAFVTCPIGIHMVGYTMMCMGICGSISSYVSGVVISWLGRKTQIVFAALANMAVLAVLLYWHPTTDSYVPYFVILGVWGVSDGIWVAQINSFLCVHFPEAYESAFAGLRMCQGIGVALVFGLSPSLSMLSKIYITGVWCVVSVTMYLMQDFYLALRDRRVKKGSLRMRQTSV